MRIRSLLFLFLTPYCGHAFLVPQNQQQSREHWTSPRSSKGDNSAHSANDHGALFSSCWDPTNVNRRQVMVVVISCLTASTSLPTLPTYAAYGSASQLQLPNPYQFLSDRDAASNPDTAKFLYKGTDATVLLGRVQKAGTAMEEIPTLAESKKWSQILGILNGPMGELIRTLGQLAQDDPKAQKQVKELKQDLYAIAAAVDKKNIAAVLSSQQKASTHLIAFVQGFVSTGGE